MLWLAKIWWREFQEEPLSKDSHGFPKKNWIPALLQRIQHVKGIYDIWNKTSQWAISADFHFIKSRIPRQVVLWFNHSPTINQWKLHAQSTRPRWWEMLIPIFQCRYHFNVPLIVFTHWPTKQIHCQFHCQSTNPIWWNVFISNVIFKPWMTLETMIRQAWDANCGPDWKLPLRVSCALERFDTVKSLIRVINP